MNILCHIRSDYSIKHGGDVSLLKKYISILESFGNTVKLTGNPYEDLDGFDIGFTINLDRPLEPYIFAKRCKARNIPVYLYTLHHPQKGVFLYLKHGVSGVRRSISKFVRSKPARYEAIVAFLKTIADRKSPIIYKAWLSLNHHNTQLNLLRICKKVLCSSVSELNAIKAEYNDIGSKLTVVPHAFDITSSDTDTSDCEVRWDVVCAGRIESRKNQLAIAGLAKRHANLKFLFIGGASISDPQYAASVRKELNELDNVEMIDNLSLDLLRHHFRCSTIFISASWFEVVSLTELEAYQCGCKLVVCEHSYILDFVDKGVFTFDPGVEESIECAFDAANQYVLDIDLRRQSLLKDPFIRLEAMHVAQALLSALELTESGEQCAECLV